MQRGKNKFRGLLITLIFLLTFSSFSMVGANGGTKNLAKGNLAEIFGSYDYTSNQLTTVIVELNEPSLVESKHKGQKQSKQNLKSVRESVKANLQSVVSDAVVNREYDYIFSGFSVELKEKDIPSLLAVEGIKAVYPNVQYYASTIGEPLLIGSEEFHPLMDDSAPHIGANEAWELGWTGKGITVAIIDTGVDYTHPDLAHAFGDYKGYDFVDNNDDPQEGPGQYHGTHVAGTVAANGGIKGVAPEASLLAYRVLGPNGGTTEDVVAGIELAVQDGADVMNLSLGNTLNSPDWATSIALDWAMAEGVVAVTSNGNSGPNNWTVGSPGTSREAISVGATQLPYSLYNATLYTSEEANYPSTEIMGYPNDDALVSLNNNTYEYVDVGLGLESDFAGLDLTGKIALISRGAIPFVDKATNAKNAGAEAVIIYNHLAGQIPFVIPGMAVPTIKLDNVDGQKMLTELAAGNNNVTITIDLVGEVGETMAGFSSRGPAASTWMIKPDVSAPGVAIVSTMPGNSYAALQGTSMSSPHVAGAAALLLQKNPGWSPFNVKSALMNTAEKLYDLNGDIYPHNAQGAGSIRVVDALYAETLIMPGSYSFGVFSKEEGRQSERQSFEVKNVSNVAKNYSFEFSFKNASVDKAIKVTTSRNVRVQPGKAQSVNMTVAVNAANLDPGYYEGSIKVSDGKQSFDVPTILFIQEPDYKRVTHASFVKHDENDFTVFFFAPGGAEVVDVVIYKDEPWSFTGIGTTQYNFPAGYHDLKWNGKVNGENLDSGLYHMFIFVEKAGVTDFVYAGEFSVME